MTPDEVKAMNAKVYGKNPKWNTYPFDCPRCGKHFPIGHTRLKLHASRYYHDACATALNANRPDKTPRTSRRTETPTECWTCKQPLATLRTTINKYGYTVHKNCPTKKRAH